MSLPIHLFSPAIYTAQALTASSISTSIPIDEARSYCIQYVITGTPVGSLQVKGSNDGITYSNVPGSQYTVAISAAGSGLIPDPSPCYSYVQLVYTFTSGTGSISAILNAKR